MLLRCDKFFIAELQKAGYDLDYKKIVDIYRKSRENDACKKRKADNLRDAIAMEELAEKIGLK